MQFLLGYLHECFKYCVLKHIFPAQLASSSQQEEEVYFDFRKQCFIYSKERETFCKLPYPSKEAFGYYLKSSGHGSEAKVIAATEKWGRNAWVCLPFTLTYPSAVQSN